MKDLTTSDLAMYGNQWVYLVVGETGEYDDFTEWSVAVYDDESSAAKHAEAATLWCQLLKDALGSNMKIMDPLANPYDPACVMDWLTGTSYSVKMVMYNPKLNLHDLKDTDASSSDTRCTERTTEES